MGTCICRVITAACCLLSFSPAAAQTAPQLPSSRAEVHVAGRHRLAVSVGAWRLTEEASEPSAVRVGASTADVSAGLQYTRFLSEAVAVALGMQVLPYESGVAVGPGGVAVGTRTIVALPFGVRWNPVAARTRTSALKPYVSGTIGPVIGSGDGVRVGPRGVAVNSDTAATIGGSVGGR